MRLLDPASAAFLMGESRNVPMHVASLQLFDPPRGGGAEWASDLHADGLAVEDVAPLWSRYPVRSLTTAGQWTWAQDRELDLEYHVRRSALPQPGRIRELLELCSRLHGQRLSLERPLWEATLIEGLADGRVALFTKMHHALIDGVSASRLMQAVLTDDPTRTDLAPPWAAGRGSRASARGPRGAADLPQRAGAPMAAAQQALAMLGEAAGLPAATLRTLNAAARGDAGPVSVSAPRSILNQRITGARRFAAQDWPMKRIKAVGAAAGGTLNDVVLSMCSGALRRYLLDQHALPEQSLVAMVPVSLRRDAVDTASAAGGNATGVIMVSLGTHLERPEDRLQAVGESMSKGKQALSAMSSAQLLAMSALGVGPSLLLPMLGLESRLRPPFNLVISNVPGPRSPLYYNGARLTGMYPLSIPMHGQAMNITCTSYADALAFGLVGCRRTVPHLQRLLSHLDDELTALELAVGIR